MTDVRSKAKDEAVSAYDKVNDEKLTTKEKVLVGYGVSRGFDVALSEAVVAFDLSVDDTPQYIMDIFAEHKNAFIRRLRGKE